MKLLFVAAVAAALIYYIGKEVFAAFRHLSEQELIDFWKGQTPAAVRRRISEHLASCSSCRDRLDEVRRHHTGPGTNSPLIDRKY
ncbi:hypothetical protein QWY85_20630 [Neolewinella lacunae]|uniref:Putative zinc-finger domain-containing protein n=1 Tax=Neolewinella lacunae TaxID=1517758 RepID=A0A923T6W4_9BACT|nr:zf-HC2 domain-containing protein [Neolewinella lacunae]MBC6993850.1 hypothetical protein [Neolewinella lacunae]MDN3637089.1 hypothetical protein [Neolewinella lacunae]